MTHQAPKENVNFTSFHVRTRKRDASDSLEVKTRGGLEGKSCFVFNVALVQCPFPFSVAGSNLSIFSFLFHVSSPSMLWLYTFCVISQLSAVQTSALEIRIFFVIRNCLSNKYCDMLSRQRVQWCHLFGIIMISRGRTGNLSSDSAIMARFACERNLRARVFYEHAVAPRIHSWIWFQFRCDKNKLAFPCFAIIARHISIKTPTPWVSTSDLIEITLTVDSQLLKFYFSDTIHSKQRKQLLPRL